MRPAARRGPRWRRIYDGGCQVFNQGVLHFGGRAGLWGAAGPKSEAVFNDHDSGVVSGQTWFR
eukprot:11026721-Lingulodinium_polyedra.AAC.1